MDQFDIEFVTELFLDTDATTSMNRLVVAVADVITENSDNVDTFLDVLDTECSDLLDSELGSRGDSTPKIKSAKFYEDTVLNYTDREYAENFNMKRSTMEALIGVLHTLLKTDVNVVPLDKKAHIFVWVMMHDWSYSEVANLFGIHKSSVSYIFHEIASLLAEERFNYINWPTMVDQHITRIKVNSRYKFPNCVGFIDVCRFKVGSKRCQRNKPKTILLQAVCDESLAFMDVHIGDPGMTKKSKVFKQSMLYPELKNFVQIDNHILGDSEYKLSKNLITPFSSDEVLNHEEMKFNEVHWKARGYIGHAFELLKGRFRKLTHLDNHTKPDAIKTLLYAACVLHNFLLVNEGSSHVKDEPITCDDSVVVDPTIVKTAEEKRQFLCNYINYIDAT